MAALPLLATQPEGLHPPISPQPQGPPPPCKTKLPVADPAELVTCDQTIEHTVRFAKQTLGWTTPRPRHPEQADRWTWLVLSAYSQLRLARPVACDQHLPGSGPDHRCGCHRCGSAAGFPGCWSDRARQRARRNPQDARQAGQEVAARVPPGATRRSKSPPRSAGTGRPGPQRPPDWPTHPSQPPTSVDGQPGIPWVKSQAKSLFLNRCSSMVGSRQGLRRQSQSGRPGPRHDQGG
jgi:hypothetical protein